MYIPICFIYKVLEDLFMKAEMTFNCFLKNTNCFLSCVSLNGLFFCSGTIEQCSQDPNQLTISALKISVCHY